MTDVATEETAVRVPDAVAPRSTIAPTAEQAASAAANARREETQLAELLETATRTRQETEARANAARQYETERAVMLQGFSDAFTAQADTLLQRKVTTAAEWFTLAQELTQLRSEFDRQVSESARDDRERFLGTADFVRRFTETHPSAKLMQWLAPLVG
jgi:hypothetical protein